MPKFVLFVEAMYCTCLRHPPLHHPMTVRATTTSTFFQGLHSIDNPAHPLHWHPSLPLSYEWNIIAKQPFHSDALGVCNQNSPMVTHALSQSPFDAED